MPIPKWIGLAGFLGTSATGGGLTTYYLFKPNDHKKYSDQVTQLNLQLGEIEKKIEESKIKFSTTSEKLDKASLERADFEEKKKCYEQEKKNLEDYSNWDFISKGLWPFVFKDCDKYSKNNPFTR